MTLQRVSTGYKPHKYQKKLLASLKRFNVFVCHRRFGKTVAAVNILIDSALRFPRNDGRFAYVAPFMNQARAIAWDYVKAYTHMIPGIKYIEQTATVEFPNGNKLRLYGADNAEAMRGLYFDGIVMDEVADMRPHVWAEIVRPALADRLGWAVFIGTPKGINVFSELYQQAVNDPNWYAEIFRASDTDLIPESELKEAAKTLTKNQYAQEFECDFSANSEDNLIDIHVVNAACKTLVHESEVMHSPVILGVDVARYGSDRSCIFRRQGIKAFEPITYNDISNMDLAAEVARIADQVEPDAIFIDAGRGEGVIDRLLQLGYDPIEINFGGKASDPHYANKRAEMWDQMKRWLDNGGCLPDHKDLKTDLCVPTFTYKNAANKFQLESKDEIKKRGMKSPDLADALALTFAYPVARKKRISGVVFDNAMAADTGYSMFANGYNPFE